MINILALDEEDVCICWIPSASISYCLSKVKLILFETTHSREMNGRMLHQWGHKYVAEVGRNATIKY